jgi:hypothetical protein
MRIINIWKTTNYEGRHHLLLVEIEEARGWNRQGVLPEVDFFRFGIGIGETLGVMVVARREVDRAPDMRTTRIRRQGGLMKVRGRQQRQGSRVDGLTA